MDEERKSTLRLMASLVDRLSVRDAGYQLILIAKDYAEDGDLVEARNHLARIHRDYFTDHIHDHVAASKDFAQAVALLIDIFGVFLELQRSSALA